MGPGLEISQKFALSDFPPFSEKWPNLADQEDKVRQTPKDRTRINQVYA